MIVYNVSVQVKEGREEDFRKATKINHDNTRREKGNLRFDVLQSADNPSHFMLYEVYRSEEAVTAHKATAHYREWREAVAPWMAADRQGTKLKVLYPKDEIAW